MADLLIITTHQMELKAVLEMITNHSGQKVDIESQLVFYSAQIRANSRSNALETIIILMPETGRVNASRSTMHAINKWQPKYVFLIGLGAGISNRVELGDILIASNVIDLPNIKVNKKNTLRPNSYHVS